MAHASAPEDEVGSPRGSVDDDEAVEHDPTGRFCRYNEAVGQGRFKQVYKGFDEEQGIDVAWSKISGAQQQLTKEERTAIVNEMAKGLLLDHPNIIKCYHCWDDRQTKTINLMTELFTSGNLRQYRQAHKHLDIKALKKWGRQILKGLCYIHSQNPPVVHGDLRCDKIYVNGHSGEIKIGDLGLTTLLPRRLDESDSDAQATLHNETMDSPAFDVFAFGLCMLELMSLHQLDPTHCGNWQDAVQHVAEPVAASFVSKCLDQESRRPTAQELLEDSFLQRAPPASERARMVDSGASPAAPPTFNLSPTASGPMGESAHSSQHAPSDLADARDAAAGPDWEDVEYTKIKGEDFSFRFKALRLEGTHEELSFKVVIVAEGDKPTRLIADKRKVAMKFEFSPEDDTAEAVAEEFGYAFKLSETDISIFAAGIKEWASKLGSAASHGNDHTGSRDHSRGGGTLLTQVSEGSAGLSRSPP